MIAAARSAPRREVTMRYNPRFQFCMQRSRPGSSRTLDCRFTSMDQCLTIAAGISPSPAGHRPRCFPNPNFHGSR